MNRDLRERLRNLPPEKRRLLAERMRSEGRGIEPDLDARYEPFPLSATQRAYLSGSRAERPFSRGSGLVYTELVITGPLDDLEKRLNHAFAMLLERHDMLRMELLPGNRQRVRPFVQAPHIEVVPASEQDGAGRLRDEARSFRFSLDQGDLPLRVWAFQESADRVAVCTLLSALVIDGTSRFRLGWELHMLLEEPDVALPQTDLSYRDCVLALAEERPDPAWLERVESMPPPIPAQPEPAESDFVHWAAVVLESGDWERLKRLGAEHGVGAAALATTAYCGVVADELRLPAFSFPMMSSFRPPQHPDVESVVGNFNTSVPAQYENVGELSARASRMQAQLGWCLDHKDGFGLRYMRGVADRHGRPRQRPASELLINCVFDYSVQSVWRLARISKGARYRIEERAYWFAIPSIAFLATFAQDDDGGFYFRLAYERAVEPTVARIRDGFTARLRELLAPAAWGEPEVPACG